MLNLKTILEFMSFVKMHSGDQALLLRKYKKQNPSLSLTEDSKVASVDNLACPSCELIEYRIINAGYCL